jgi:hypothetical protein
VRHIAASIAALHNEISLDCAVRYVRLIARRDGETAMNADHCEHVIAYLNYLMMTCFDQAKYRELQRRWAYYRNRNDQSKG